MNLKYDDIENDLSNLIYIYKSKGLPGHYLNKINIQPSNERPDVIMKLEISLTNSVDETKYIFWISKNGTVFSVKKAPQLHKIISAWIKKPKVHLLDCGVMYV